MIVDNQTSRVGEWLTLLMLIGAVKVGWFYILTIDRNVEGVVWIMICSLNWFVVLTENLWVLGYDRSICHVRWYGMVVFTCGSIQSRSGDWIGLGLVELVGIWGRVSCDEHLDALPQIKNPLYPRQSGMLCSQTQIYQRPSRLPLYAKQNLCIEKVVRSLQTCVHDPVFIYVGCPGLQKLGWVRHLTKTQTDNRMKILHHPNKSHDTCRYAQLLFW